MVEPLLEKIREINDGNFDDDAGLDPSSWDSVDMLDIISIIDVSYDVTIPVDQIKTCRTVGDLRRLIHSVAAAAS